MVTKAALIVAIVVFADITTPTTARESHAIRENAILISGE